MNPSHFTTSPLALTIWDQRAAARAAGWTGNPSSNDPFASLKRHCGVDVSTHDDQLRTPKMADPRVHIRLPDPQAPFRMETPSDAILKTWPAPVVEQHAVREARPDPVTPKHTLGDKRFMAFRTGKVDQVKIVDTNKVNVHAGESVVQIGESFWLVGCVHQTVKRPPISGRLVPQKTAKAAVRQALVSELQQHRAAFEAPGTTLPASLAFLLWLKDNAGLPKLLDALAYTGPTLATNNKAHHDAVLSQLIICLNDGEVEEWLANAGLEPNSVRRLHEALQRWANEPMRDGLKISDIITQPNDAPEVLALSSLAFFRACVQLIFPRVTHGAHPPPSLVPMTKLAVLEVRLPQLANALKAAFHNWRTQGQPAGDMDYVYKGSGREALLSRIYSSAAQHDEQLAICRHLFRDHGMLSGSQLDEVYAEYCNRQGNAP